MKKFLKPIADVFRKIIFRLLGVPDWQNRYQTTELHVRDLLNNYNDLVHKVVVQSDRVGIVESILNWRLYGLPSKIINIKLEQLQQTTGYNEIEWAISQFQTTQPFINYSILDNILDSSLSKILLFPGDNNGDYKYILNKCPNSLKYIIEDSSDLYRYKNVHKIDETDIQKILHTSGTNYLGLFSTNDWNLIWLSNVLERLTPVQTLVLLKKAVQSISSNGKLIGYFLDYEESDSTEYFIDIRRIRPLNKNTIQYYFSLCGINKIELISESNQKGRYFYIVYA